jgi:hypothetical protein
LGDEAQGGHAGYKEIGAAAGFDKLGRAITDKGGLATIGTGGNHKLGVRAVVANNGASIVARIKIKSILHPLLLNELELPEETGAEKKQ